MKRALTVVLGVATGCYTGIGGPSGSGDDAPGADDGGSGNDDSGDDGDPAREEPDEEAPTFATHSGLRRLTVDEYDNTVRDLLYDDSRPASEFLPADAYSPFDNDYAGQAPSETLILGAEKLASEAAAGLLEDPDRLAAVVGCIPAGVDDAGCFREFIVNFGRRAYRRPLENAEVDDLATLLPLGAEAGDWNVAAVAVVQAVLQDPNFLYRVEIGEPVAGVADVVRLSDWEVASRLSYFLWATTPDDALLDAAAGGALSTAADVRGRATMMLKDERALDSIERFHAMWLGYVKISDGGLNADMRAETNALLERVVVEQERPWADLFTSTESFLTPDLATHYGMSAPDGSDGWVDYGPSGRGGILSHGMVLTLGGKFGDTSPTTRGKEVRERFFCQKIELPDDQDVNTDDPPGVDPTACKYDRYEAHRSVAACAGCHRLTDDIGFGLENYDATGAFRLHDFDKPQCEITGEGEVVGEGKFNGPAELGALLAASETVRTCSMQQVLRFASGRTELDDLDEMFIEQLEEQVGAQDMRLADLLIEMAASDGFRFRAIEEGE